MSMIPQFKVLNTEGAIKNVVKVLGSGYLGQGPRVEEFELELRQALGSKYVVTVNSATSALWLALHLIGVKPGDNVISTPMTCSATNEVIKLMGANIIWADVDDYGNIDSRDVYKKVWTNNAKAVMAVDWGGLPCDYAALREVLKGQVPIVEDAAHAFMAKYMDKNISVSGGDYVCFSFQAIKSLTTGDGGALITPPLQYERARLLRWYGLDRTQGDAMRCYQDIAEPGFKFHMNDINAAIGLGNLPAAIESVEKARANAIYLDEKLKWRYVWPAPEKQLSSFWLYTTHVPFPRKFEKYMKSKGIMVSQVHNRNDEFSCFEENKVNLPGLDTFFKTMICLPVGWWLSRIDLDKIVRATNTWLSMSEEKMDQW